VFEFLNIMGATPALPAGLHWMQKILVRAAVELLPVWIRARLGLGAEFGLQRQEAWLAELAGAAAERIVMPTSPAVLSCLRLGLPTAYLYSPVRAAQAQPVLEYTPQPAYFVAQSNRNL
jgi:uncharacterized protein (DUF2236 family)